jgi:SAM-dependent methyltransferase
MSDLLRITRAIAGNQLARFAPSAYVRHTKETGRGAGTEESAADMAAYFHRCVDDYFERLPGAPGDRQQYLAGKTLMEYGPGDLPGVAALMVAFGAEKVFCVDRFPLMRLSAKNLRAVHQLTEGCDGPQQDRLRSCLSDAGDPSAGFDPRRIEYLVKADGISGLEEQVDLVLSRAVLEHVNDLEATFGDMVAAMRPGAIAIHKVDLRSHGKHRSNVLDFLERPQWLWSLMYSEKGVPNRWRINTYREILAALPVRVLSLEPTTVASVDEVRQVRPRLAEPFRHLGDADLSWLGFWVVFQKEAP